MTSGYAVLHERQRGSFASVELTEEQQAKLDTILAWAVFHQPFFAHLLLSELPIKPVADVPIAATDSFFILINPETFFQYEVPECAFILFHEVLHCVFNDPVLLSNWVKKGSVRVGDTDWPLDVQALNIAMDFVINAQLIEGKCGRFNKAWLYNPNYSAKGHEAMVNVYEQVLKNAPNPNQNQFDTVLVPGQSKPEEEPVKERDPVEWQSAVASAALAADMQGKLPQSLRQLVGEILEPKVSWQDHLRATIMRVNGSEGLDWSQADRRMLARSEIGYDPIYFGRPTGFGAGTVVIGWDSSGSMNDPAVQARIFGETAGILADLNPRELVIMFCDAKVHEVAYLSEPEELEPLRVAGVPGGGGTSFVPVFRKIEELGLEPDMLIYFTDTYGRYPDDEPSYPTVWGILGPSRNTPWGEQVLIDL